MLIGKKYLVIFIKGPFMTDKMSPSEKRTDEYLLGRFCQIVRSKPKQSYWYQYNFIRIKRFVYNTSAAFFLQYLTLIHLSATYPALPMYPPIGSAFVMLYILGNNPLVGLLLGSFCAYFFHGLSLPCLLLYIGADIGGAYIGVNSCNYLFSTDNFVHSEPKEWFCFLFVNACASCLFSSFLRLTAMLILVPEMPANRIFFQWVNVWLSDINAMLVFAGFFLTWMSVYLGRETILYDTPSRYAAMIGLVFVICFALSIRNPVFMLVLWLLSFVIAYGFGILLSTAATYSLSILFLIHFVVHQQFFLQNWGLHIYTIIPAALCTYLVSILYIGQRSSKRQFLNDQPE